MQTKKRAKPVKFGKAAPNAARATSDGVDKKEETTSNVAAKNIDEKLVKITAEADMNSAETKELKQIIEEKTHPTESNSVKNEKGDSTSDVEENQNDELPEQEEAIEEEPKEVNLSENPPEKQEEDMPLENTESATEIEPDELHEKETTSQYGSFNKEPVQTKSKSGYLKFFLLVTCITFVVGFIIICGISYFSSTMNSGSTMIISNQNPSPTPSTSQGSSNEGSGPTASPTPEKPDLSAYSVKVLNGSGTTGEAAKVRSLLEDKGFSIDSVGNATTSDYTKTEISAKKSVSEVYINELIKTLKDDYSVNSVVDSASSSQATDVVVIIGSDSAQ